MDTPPPLLTPADRAAILEDSRKARAESREIVARAKEVIQHLQREAPLYGYRLDEWRARGHRARRVP